MSEHDKAPEALAAGESPGTHVTQGMDERTQVEHTAEELASAVGARDEVETVFKVLEHLAANKDHGVGRTEGPTPFDARYQAV